MQHTHPAEQWRPIPGYEGLYEVSDHGRVRSLDRVVRRGAHTLRLPGEIKALVDNGHGRKRAYLSRDGQMQRPQVHRLVLETFVGPCPAGMEACHNDGNPANNRLENLRWDTGSENMRDKRRHGTDHQVNKTTCPRGHALAGLNLRNRGDGHRSCRACNRASAKRAADPSIDFGEYADQQYARLNVHTSGPVRDG